MCLDGVYVLVIHNGLEVTVLGLQMMYVCQMQRKSCCQQLSRLCRCVAFARKERASGLPIYVVRNVLASLTHSATRGTDTVKKGLEDNDCFNQRVNHVCLYCLHVHVSMVVHIQQNPPHLPLPFYHSMAKTNPWRPAFFPCIHLLLPASCRLLESTIFSHSGRMDAVAVKSHSNISLLCRTFIPSLVKPPEFRETDVIVVGLHSDISLFCRTVISTTVKRPEFWGKIAPPPLHIGHSVTKKTDPQLKPRFWEPEGAGGDIGFR